MSNQMQIATEPHVLTVLAPDASQIQTKMAPVSSLAVLIPPIISLQITAAAAGTLPAFVMAKLTVNGKAMSSLAISPRMVFVYLTTLVQ